MPNFSLKSNIWCRHLIFLQNIFSANSQFFPEVKYLVPAPSSPSKYPLPKLTNFLSDIFSNSLTKLNLTRHNKHDGKAVVKLSSCSDILKSFPFYLPSLFSSCILPKFPIYTLMLKGSISSFDRLRTSFCQ